MAIKINGKWRGESPKEQLQMEKTKFLKRIKRTNKKIVNPKTGQAYLVPKRCKEVKLR